MGNNNAAEKLIERAKGRAPAAAYAQTSTRSSDVAQSLLARGVVESDDGAGCLVVSGDGWRVSLAIGDEWREVFG